MANRVIFILLSVMLCFGSLSAAKKSVLENKKDSGKFFIASILYSDGKYSEALTELDKLAKRYPNDKVVIYQRALTLYHLERYQEVADAMKQFLEKNEGAVECYQIWGNALDMLHQPNEAIDIYNSGLKKFPNSGPLYHEIGNVYRNWKQNDRALQYYNYAIEVDPNYAPDYYRAAEIYFATDTTAWGLVYAETEILLTPGNQVRMTDMSKEMAKCYAEKFEMNDTAVKVNLAPSTNITINGKPGDIENDKNVTIGVSGIMESCYRIALRRFKKEDRLYDPTSLESLTLLRRYMVEAYFDVADNYFGNGLYLLEFQKKIIDAGHWDAYNWFLFSQSLPFDANIWMTIHKDELVAFVNWFNDEKNRFLLGDGRSVSKFLAPKYARKMTMIESFMFLNKLNDYEAEEKEETNE